MKDFENVLPHTWDALGKEHDGDERYAAERARCYSPVTSQSMLDKQGGAGGANKPVRLRRGYPAMLSAGRILCQSVSSMAVPGRGDRERTSVLGTVRRSVASLASVRYGLTGGLGRGLSPLLCVSRAGCGLVGE